jgi:nitrogen fixation protein NifU and related proteins
VNKEEGLLREILEEHASNPCGQEELSDTSHSGEWMSRKTGNLCSVQIKVHNDQVLRMVARVEGSALAKACASIMCSELEGKSIESARTTMQVVEKWIEFGEAPENWPGELVVYQSLVQFPERLDCATLCWRSLKNALED